MKRKMKFLQGFLISIVFVLASGCQPNSPTPAKPAEIEEIQNIQVQTSNPQKTVGSAEDFPLPNCGGTGKLTQTLGTQVSISKTVELGATVSVRGGGEVSVSPATKLKLEAAVEAAYKQNYDSANSRLDTIVMEAAPKSHVIYTIEWERQEFSSVTTFELDREVVQTPYLFTMNVPKISGSREEPCQSGNTTLPLPPANLPEQLSIAGDWEGITGGTDPSGEPLTEVVTKASIPKNCEAGDICGNFSTVYCAYEMTFVEIQGDVFIFKTLSIGGEDFCNGGTVYARAEFTIISDTELRFRYQTTSNLVREGTLTRK